MWIFPILVHDIRHLDSIFDRIRIIPCLFWYYRRLTPKFLPRNLISLGSLQILVIIVLLYNILFRLTSCPLSYISCDFELVVWLVMAVDHGRPNITLGRHCFLASENLELKGFPPVGHVQLKGRLFV